MDIFSLIHSKVLDRKRKVSKLNRVKNVSIPDAALNTKDEINFVKGSLYPLIDQTSFYLYESLLDDIIICYNCKIDYRVRYSILEFYNKSKISILVFNNNVLVDPDKVHIHIINKDRYIIHVDGVISNVNVLIIKGALIFNRYNINTSVSIDNSLINSYMIFTNGLIDWIPYTGSTGSYKIPISAQGKVMILIASNIIFSYKSVPLDNGTYKYINYPVSNEFVELTNTLVFKKGISGYEIPTEYTPLTDGFKISDINERIIVYFSKKDIGNYTDLKNHYNLYRNYIAEYLSSSLPTSIANYIPYVPNITSDTLYADFINEMKLASKDYINIYKKYLEDISTFQLTNWNTAIITPEFKRNSTVIYNNSIIGINMPRFDTNNIFKQGILIDDTISNLNKDPLFATGINNGLIHDSMWSIPFQDDIDIKYSIKDNILHHYSLMRKDQNRSIKIISPTTTFDKTKICIIQFKLKYIKKIESYSLYISGGIVNNLTNNLLKLEIYRVKTEIGSDGFEYREYKIPANTFNGSISTGNISLSTNTAESIYVDYYIKEFQIINKDYAVDFYPGIKEKEILKIPSSIVLSPIEGSIGIWLTPKKLYDGERVLQTDTPSSNISLRSVIYINSNGSIVFELKGSTNKITSINNLVKSNIMSYIAITWKSNTMYAYHNGILIGSIITGTPSFGNTLYVGCSAEEDKQLNGIIHDIRISNILRTSSDVLSLYNLKESSIIDANTTYKMRFDNTIGTPNDLIHPTRLYTKLDPKELLFFNAGLNITPVSYNRMTDRTYKLNFRENDIKNNIITGIDIGKDIVPYVENMTISDITFNIGPSSKINPNTRIEIYESSEDVESLKYAQPAYSLLTDKISGDIFYSGYIDGKIVKLNSITLEEITSNYLYGGPIHSMTIGIDDNLYIGGDNVYKIKKLNRDTLALISESFSFGGAIRFLKTGIDGSIYMVGGNSIMTVKKINPATFAIEAESPRYDGGIFSMTIGLDGKVYIGGISVNKVWKLNSTTLIKESESPDYEDKITALETGLNGSIYAGGYSRNTVWKLNPITLAKEAESVNYGGGINVIRVGKDGFIYIGGEFTQKIYKLFPNTLVKEIESKNNGGEIYSIAIGNDGELFVGSEPEIPITKYEKTSLNIYKNKKLTKILNTEYTYIIDRNLIRIAINASHVGKNVHVCTQDYNRSITKLYSDTGLLKVPSWTSFIPKNNMNIFLNGRLLPRENSYLFSQFQYNITKNDTVISLDIDTDVVDKEIITLLVSSHFEIIDYNIDLTNGTKIIEITNKTYPFSKKYHLIFIDGKFINPSDIIEIDSYRFSIKSNSINNLCIFRKNFNIPNSDKFVNLIDKWAEYLAILTITEIESIIGPLNQSINSENNTRPIYFDNRHLFEILYNYCMKDRRELLLVDNKWIRDEIPGVLLTNGKLPISNIRPAYPRYKL